jgi:glyoxylase I family protein
MTEPTEGAVVTAQQVEGQQPPKTLIGLHHVGLTVTDVAASEAWYGRVLGLRRVAVEPHHGSDNGGYAVILGAEDLGFNVGLDHHPDNDDERFSETRTGLDHVCLHVSNATGLEPWAEHLTREGVEHSGIVPVEGMPFAVLCFRDPDGIALELISAT